MNLLARYAFSALTWAKANARLNRADPGRLAAVVHDAGGNIATGLAAIARDRGGDRLKAQALLAPLLDTSMTRLNEGGSSSLRTFDTSNFVRFYRAYLPQPSQRVHPYAAPLESRRLSTMPPTLIASAEDDLVRADGETYARELITAGVPVEMTGHCGVSHDELVAHATVLTDVVEFLRKWLKK